MSPRAGCRRNSLRRENSARPAGEDACRLLYRQVLRLARAGGYARSLRTVASQQQRLAQSADLLAETASLIAQLSQRNLFSQPAAAVLDIQCRVIKGRS